MKSLKAVRLPKLTAILAFETAAKTGSLASAAVQLSLTPAAISQQIRQLEQHLAIQLFTRSTSGVELTPQGSAYLAYVQQAFETLRMAQQSMARDKGELSLNIFALPALASRWLNPNLKQWLTQYPDTDIRIHATHAPVDFNRTAADFYLAFGDEHYPQQEKVRLFQDWVFPVASPELLTRPWSEGKKQINYPMIQVDWGKEGQFLPDWHEWLLSAKWLQCTPNRGPIYNLTSMAIDAALAGNGILLGQQQLIKKELADGRLIQLSKHQLPVTKPYYLIYPKRTLDKPRAAEFIQWMLSLC
ncbi:bacterial regulatory helix-turn-helix, lysR family protein [Yersinia rohdei]|uniref:Bacterial regulatory helix-turn-helix, lysR family protein n=1 Tax=Yersinia rohdei TaxID=29485 RepID=A0A0U1HPM2_YERRO|nr:LysR substrate-binding domain-containing protein [Yersinia rohdei]AJJ12490.1 bacterial regulatory helix-turn-helix, lysR family protein [Yersinia rohdei]EEQ04201.1 Transcriptional regulator, LysR family [Yersinia rohdei ATCC 43380]MDN0092884.1 LysR substrate-binding domain-containing protein [Yersinia rohdei]CQI88477.1 DNA-binding transcriptional activator GcvA [Yersinia rohdei]